MSDALANLLVRWRWPLLALAAALAVASIVPAQRLKLDRSIESLYAADDPILLDYRKSKKLFGGDEFVIVAWHEPNLLDREGKLTDRAGRDIRELSNELSRVGGVNRASTQDLAGVVASAVRFAQETAAERFGGSRLLRGIAGRYALERQQEAIEFSRGILISADGKTTAIVLRLKPEDEAPIPREQTIRRIRERAADYAKRWKTPIHVAGEPVQVFDAFEYVEQDGRNLFLASLLLLGGVLLVLFRNLRWVLLPLAVTGTAVLWTLATLQLWGSELSMVSSMLNSLVTIVGVSIVTHAAVTYREWRRRLGRLDALRRSLAELSIPIFWNILTTVAGFESLVTSNVQPVRSFGIMTALGTGLVLVAAALIVPGGTVFAVGARERRPSEEDTDHRHPRVTAALLRATAFGRRHAAGISIASLVLAAVSIAGMTRMDVETDFTKNFRADSPIVRALDFIEQNLGGAGTWEVNFPAPKTLTPQYLDRVRGFADDLRGLKIGKEKPLTKVIAITDGLDLLPNNMRTGDVSKDLALIGRLQPEFVPSLYNAEHGRMRIVLRSWERRQAEEKRRVIEAVEAAAAKRFDGPDATGLFVLLTYVIESLMQSQYVSFGLASGAIFAMMLLAFRRILLSLVALLPSALPIAMLLGGMGMLGIPVNIGTAMIASVSIGLTIDSSIHYLIAYREARDRGATVAEALDATSGHVGVALVFATLALSVGFTVLALSNFVPLIYFGVLVSLAMIGGLLGNLLLLPALVPWVDRDAPKPTEALLEAQPAT
jgi:predicted RND superfamily exporter protein